MNRDKLRRKGTIKDVFNKDLGLTAVADPGFPVGGGAWTSYGGPWTPEAATFQKFCMSKRKNLDP